MAVLGLVEIVRRHQHGDARRRDSVSIRRQNWRRDSGSTPPVGSSRKTIGGSWRIAQPSARRCRQPPARSRAQRLLAAGEAGHLDARSARRASSSLAIEPVDAAEEADVLIDGQQLVEREPLRHVADAALDAFRIAADVDAADRRGAATSARAGRTACGSSSTCRRRCCRGTRRSRRARTSKLTSSTATNCAEAAGQVDGRRCARPADVRAFIVAEAPAPAAPPPAATFAIAGVRSSSACSRATCASSTSVLARDARAVAFADDALGFGGGADRVVRGADRRAAGVELQRSAARTLEGHLAIEVGDARPERRALARASPLLRRATAAVPAAATTALIDASHESCQSPVRGKMRGLGRA